MCLKPEPSKARMDSMWSRQYEGGYSDYQIAYAIRHPEESIAAGMTKPEKEKTKKIRVAKLKFTYKEQKEYDTIDDDIAALEEKIEDLEKKILASARDFVKLNEYTAEKEKAEEMLAEKMDRWVYLNELAEQIAKQ